MPKCFILSIYYKITNVVLKVIFDKIFTSLAFYISKKILLFYLYIIILNGFCLCYKNYMYLLMYLRLVLIFISLHIKINKFKF